MKYLYLHGLGQNADSWNKVTGITNMPDNTMCLDFPEMLRDKPVTYSNLYTAFSEICDAESEDIILCGLSLGGVLALNYAIDHPQKVKALILIAAQYKMPERLLKVQNIMFHFMPPAMFHQTGFDKSDFISLCRSMEKLDFSESLNRISCSTLILCGEKDKINKKASIELSKLLKDSQFKEVSETGHEVNLESPEKLALLLRDFYKSMG